MSGIPDVEAVTHRCDFTKARWISAESMMLIFFKKRNQHLHENKASIASRESKSSRSTEGSFSVHNQKSGSASYIRETVFLNSQV